MAGLVDSLLEIVPVTYRRDVMVAVCAATMATGWFVFSARVDAAEALSKPVAAVQDKVAAIEKKQAVTEANVENIQASNVRIENKIDTLMDTLISQKSNGYLTPTKPGK